MYLLLGISMYFAKINHTRLMVTLTSNAGRDDIFAKILILPTTTFFSLVLSMVSRIGSQTVFPQTEYITGIHEYRLPSKVVCREYYTMGIHGSH